MVRRQVGLFLSFFWGLSFLSCWAQAREMVLEDNSLVAQALAEFELLAARGQLFLPGWGRHPGLIRAPSYQSGGYMVTPEPGPLKHQLYAGKRWERYDGVVPKNAVVLHYQDQNPVYGCLATHQGMQYQGKAQTVGPCTIEYNGQSVGVSDYYILVD